MLQDCPEVWEENIETYRGFWRLSPERVKAFGEGYIPWEAIQAYAREIEVDALELLDAIRQMDREYLQHQQRKKKIEEDQRARDQRRADRARLPRRGR